MQQHPIPQNVTQYQFRLVGDMTLKQFLELCIGLGLAYLFFASNLIFIIKWPMIIFSILFGAALAFFPIEDRPLDQWIINFLKAIYMPTRFTWQKTNKIPRLFLFTAHPPEVINTITKTIKAPIAQSKAIAISDLSEKETSIVKSLDSLFNSLPPSPINPSNSPIIVEDVVEKPTVSVRKLKPVSELTDVVLNTPKTTSISIPKAEPTPTLSTAPQKVIFTSPTAPVASVAMPTASPRKITLPASPKQPNLVTGVVVDKDEKLIENAIVQIVSSDGIPQRAMKTNSLGQFYTSTPLGLGNYLIEIDKDGYTFAPQQISINDTILSPIELRASN